MGRAAASVFAAVLTGPALAGLVAFGALATTTETGPNPVDDVLSALQSPEGQRWAAQFMNGTGPSSVPDDAGDFEHSTGQMPGFTPDRLDIMEFGFAQYDLGQLADGSDPASDEARRLLEESFARFPAQLFGPDTDAPQAVGDEFWIFDVGTTGPQVVGDPGRCEVVIWADDANNPNTFAELDAFPEDPADGTNTGIGIGFNPANGGPASASTFKLAFDGQSFQPSPTNAFGVVHDLHTLLFVPINEITDPTILTPYTFCTREGYGFAPEDSGADKIDKIPVGEVPGARVALQDVGSGPSAAPSTSPSTASVPSSAASTPATTPASEDSSDLFLKALLTLGAAGAAGGVYTAARRRSSGIAPCSCTVTVTIEGRNVLDRCCSTSLTVSTRHGEKPATQDDEAAADDFSIPKDESRLHLDIDLSEEDGGGDFYDEMLVATIHARCKGGEALVGEATYTWNVTSTDDAITVSLDVEVPVRCPDGGEHPPVRASTTKTITIRQGTCRIGVVLQRTAWNEISHVDVLVSCGSYLEVFGYFPDGMRSFSATLPGAKGSVNSARNSAPSVKTFTDDQGNSEELTTGITDGVGTEDLNEFYEGLPLRIYWFTPDDCSKCLDIRRWWEERRDNPGTYYLLNNNCAQHAVASLASVGMWPWETGPVVRPGQMENMMDLHQFVGTTPGYTLAEVDVR